MTEQNAYSHLDRFEAIDLFVSVMQAMVDARLGTAVRLLGIPLPVAEDMTLDDLADACRVRSADLARVAGITIPDTP